MEEKILVKSIQKNTKIILSIFCLCGIVLALIVYSVYFAEDVQLANDIMAREKERFEAYQGKDEYFYKLAKETYEINKADRDEMLMATALCFVVVAMPGFILYFMTFGTELVVSDKRVYGKAVFGKRVDLPLDSVSAIASSWPKGIAVATSSGKVAFLMIKNRDEIHKCISDLLIERQNKPHAVPVATAQMEAPMNNTDELRKYKELLDEGIITQEEFDAKKKQLLGL